MARGIATGHLWGKSDVLVLAIARLAALCGMKRSSAILVLTLFTLLLASLALLAAYPRFKKIEKQGPAAESVAAILPGDLEAAAAAVGSAFNDWTDFDQPERIGSYQNKFPGGVQWNHFFLFHKDDPRHPLFPSDEEILLDRGVDSFVERYVRIPSELRKRDLYLYEPTGDFYWNSEYFYKGQPAKFHCSFLIHLEAAKDSGTKVEIFEYQPIVWVGEYLGLSAHAILPAMLHDIRPAQPTTGDRTEVLRMVQQAFPSPPGESHFQTR
jgi:hypothetical protein